MQIALYESHGYYTLAQLRDRSDYLTSPQTHPAFGALIATWLTEVWQKLQQPDPFQVIELGAGDGLLSAHIRQAAHHAVSNSNTSERFLKALRYTSFDIAPRPTSHTSHKEHAPPRHIRDLPHETNHAHCLISNELIDAMPVNLFTIRNRNIQERYITLDHQDRLAFTEDTPSSPEFHSRLADILHALPDGYHGEINLDISLWADTVKRLIKPRGYVLTIDYGAPRHILYHPARTEGSLRCYRDHVLGQNPLRNIGDQDITAHVDFTELDQQLQARNFKPAAPPMSQRNFLYQQGIQDYLINARKQLLQARTETQIRSSHTNLKALNALIDIRTLGAFTVAQHKTCTA